MGQGEVIVKVRLWVRVRLWSGLSRLDTQRSIA